MKKSFILCLILLSSCNLSKQQKAESVVKKYLDSALNDPHSYESVKFDTLKAQHKSYDRSDPEGKRLDTLAANYIDSSSKYKKLADRELFTVTYTNFKTLKKYQLLDTIFQKKSDSVEGVIKSNSIGYKGSLENYIINHTYRAKNGFGALSLHTTNFELDSSLTKVLYSNEVTD